MMTPGGRCVPGARSLVGVAAVLLWLLSLSGVPAARAADIDDAMASRIAMRVFLNETGGEPRRLLWWNEGEDFMSLGIGHFIWYPAGVQERFVESFPALLLAIDSAGAKLPEWLGVDADCPWPDRAAFLAADAANDERIVSLRSLLMGSLPLQARLLAERLERTLPLIVEAAPEDARERLRERYQAVASTPGGHFALVDYVNFKGEGVDPRERYGARGWGLAQVLAAMSDDPGIPVLSRFADAAAQVLKARVAASPPERDEAKWLEGWLARVERYRAE